jgi:hypothetical protein
MRRPFSVIIGPNSWLLYLSLEREPEQAIYNIFHVFYHVLFAFYTLHELPSTFDLGALYVSYRIITVNCLPAQYLHQTQLS